jgi:hypothetical protein
VRRELEGMWKGVVVAEFKVLYRHLLEGNDDKFPVCTLFSDILGLCSTLHRGGSRAVFVVGPADHEHSTTVTTIRR